MAESDDLADGRGRPIKVAGLIEKYDLAPLGDELEAAWTREGEDRRSLRELAEEFNVTLLKDALTEAGHSTLDYEPANMYAVLTGEEVSPAERTRVRRRLDRAGVDVDELADDFVSYQAIRTYLRSHRGAEYGDTDEDRVAAARDHIQRLRGRTAAVTTDKLETLEETGDLNIGEHRTIVDIMVVCESCGGRFQLADLLERGGCNCGRNK